MRRIDAIFKETRNKCLRRRIASLRGTSNLAVYCILSRFLRSVRLALHPAQRLTSCFLRWNLLELLAKVVAVGALSLSLAGCIQDEVIFFGIDKADNLRFTNIKIDDKLDGLFYASYLDGDTVVDIREPVKAEKLTSEDGYKITMVNKSISFKLVSDGRLLYCRKYKCIGCDKIQVEGAFSELPKIWGNK
jgi:hypothetical protein